MQLYLNTPCDIPCDKVIDRDYWGGMALIAAAGIIFGVERVIRPSKAASSTNG